MDDLTPEQIRDLQTVLTSRGWMLITEILRHRLEVVSRLMMQPPISRSESDDWLRGEYHALRVLLDTPSVVLESYATLLVQEAPGPPEEWYRTALNGGMRHAGFPGVQAFEGGGPTLPEE